MYFEDCTGSCFYGVRLLQVPDHKQRILFSQKNISNWHHCQILITFNEYFYLLTKLLV